jgi:phosphoribosylformimino-5-aminoimidazole carboxamide ribotide isomerase
MLIPTIDLKGGKVVQLLQGDKVAVETSDVFRWVRRFQGFGIVQLVDLDAAMGTGDNNDLVRRVSARLGCRVGGGIRSVDRAKEVVEAGAKKVILSTALFREGRPDLAFAAKVSGAIGRERVIAAVDTRDGRLVTQGWRRTIALAPVEAIRALEPYCDEFLYTDVAREGMMQGMDLDAVMAIRAATDRRLSVAGGITTRAEVEALDGQGIDAVVGMAIYTGVMDLDAFRK